VEQSQGAADCFLWLSRDCASVVMHHKAKLSTKNTIWKSPVIFVMQFGARGRTCGPHALGNCIMTMFGSFITSDPEFPGQTRHSNCSPGSLLSRHGSLWLLVVPQIDEATEGFPFSQPRGHHAERDEGAEKHSRRIFPEMLPAVKGTLG
jgi:hypothetical protein